MSGADFVSEEEALAVVCRWLREAPGGAGLLEESGEKLLDAYKRIKLNAALFELFDTGKLSMWWDEESNEVSYRLNLEAQPTKEVMREMKRRGVK